MENLNFKIHNYKCNSKQEKAIKNKLEFLLKQIPYNSCVSIDFDYKDKIFYGKLKADFNGQSFFAKDQHNILTPLASSLCKKIQKQVMKWKKTRTIEEITGIIALKTDREDLPFSYKKAV